MSKFKLRWATWLYGLLGGVIGGGASSVTSSFVVMGITPQSYNLHTELSHTLKLFFGCFLINGIISAFLWLKQKPLPELETEPDPEATHPLDRQP